MDMSQILSKRVHEDPYYPPTHFMDSFDIKRGAVIKSILHGMTYVRTGLNTVVCKDSSNTTVFMFKSLTSSWRLFTMSGSQLISELGMEVSDSVSLRDIINRADQYISTLSSKNRDKLFYPKKESKYVLMIKTAIGNYYYGSDSSSAGFIDSYERAERMDLETITELVNSEFLLNRLYEQALTKSSVTVFVWKYAFPTKVDYDPSTTQLFVNMQNTANEYALMRTRKVLESMNGGK